MSADKTIFDMIRAGQNINPYVKTICDYATVSREFGDLESSVEWKCKIIVEDHTELTNEQVEELCKNFSLTIPSEGLRMPHDYILKHGSNSVTVYVRDEPWDYDAYLDNLENFSNLTDEDILRDD